MARKQNKNNTGSNNIVINGLILRDMSKDNSNTEDVDCEEVGADERGNEEYINEEDRAKVENLGEDAPFIFSRGFFFAGGKNNIDFSKKNSYNLKDENDFLTLFLETNFDIKKMVKVGYKIQEILKLTKKLSKKIEQIREFTEINRYEKHTENGQIYAIISKAKQIDKYGQNGNNPAELIFKFGQ